MTENRHDIPFPIRAWAALPHIGVIIAIPIFSLIPSVHSTLYKINGIEPRCLIKPFPGCGKTNRLLVLIINLFVMLMIWTWPFINPCLIAIALNFSKKLHPFIRDNAERAFKFQLELAKLALFTHILLLPCLLPLAHFSIAGMAAMSLLIVGFDLAIAFWIFAGIELLLGSFAAIAALMGRINSYPQIKI